MVYFLGHNQWRMQAQSHLNHTMIVLMKILNLLSKNFGSDFGHFASFDVLLMGQKQYWDAETRLWLFEPKNGWQWCWWQRKVGDFLMVTDLRCWWQNHYVDDFFLNVGPHCWWLFQCIKSVTNISNLSPTHLISNIRHQHRCDYQHRCDWYLAW